MIDLSGFEGDSVCEGGLEDVDVSLTGKNLTAAFQQQILLLDSGPKVVLVHFPVVIYVQLPK